MSTARRVTAAGFFLAAAGLGAAGWPTAANADAPVQTGWWNNAPGGAAPAPNAPSGGLHVAVAPGQVLAFGAVLYNMPDGATGTLELKIASSQAGPALNPNAPSTSPSIPVQACPTTSAWKPGDNQPGTAAPTYDCTTHAYVGNPSADGKTLTFLVDSSADTTPGQLSLAIVPIQTATAPDGTPVPADTTQPFSLDIAKPDALSLLITSVPPVVSPPQPAGGGGSGTTGNTGGSTGTGTSTGSSGSAGVPAPPMLTGAGGPTTATDPGTAPVVAGTGAPATTPVSQTTAAAPTKSTTAHDAALGLLILLGMGILATGNGAVQRAPRLLGGAGRHAARDGEATLATAGAGVAPTTPAVPPPTPGAVLVGGQWMVPASLMGVRGLGRFASARTAPPRPLV
jgi:hypothetical protein